MTTTHECPGCTACIHSVLLTEADRERPTCRSPAGAAESSGSPAATAAEILRLDKRGSYTEDDHHRLQEIAPELARAWLARRVEYRPGLPPAAAIDAQRERGGWWQYKKPGHRPQLIGLRARRLPFLTDGAAPEILGRGP